MVVNNEQQENDLACYSKDLERAGIRVSAKNEDAMFLVHLLRDNEV